MLLVHYPRFRDAHFSLTEYLRFDEPRRLTQWEVKRKTNEYTQEGWTSAHARQTPLSALGGEKRDVFVHPGHCWLPFCLFPDF